MLWNLYQQKLNQTFISQIWESLLSLIVTLDNGIRWCWDDQFATTNTNTSHPLLSQASFLIYFCKTRWKVCYTVFLEIERTFPVTKKKNMKTAHYSVSGVSFSALLCPHQWNFERLQPLLVGIQPIQTKTTLYQCWAVGKAFSYS